jgi:glycosyltransferase involved in cell wall biosynthesis
MSAKWSFGTPLVLAEHGVYLRERYLASDSRAYSFPVRAFVLQFFRLLIGASYRIADLITPVCEYNQRWQVRTGAESDIIRAVYNGVDASRFRAADTEPDIPTLAWVGRVDPLKDVETLIRAFHRVRALIPDARLRMFGPIPAGNEGYHARCEALIRELGLDGAASFEGRAAEITDAYHAGHVVVLTSVSEAFPYTVIEAMASGRATVSTDVGGVREAVGDAGLVAPPRDADAIAAACVRLLDDPALRRSLASRARERVLDQFTLARFLDVYRGIYSDFAVKDDPAPKAERTPGLHVELVGAVT